MELDLISLVPSELICMVIVTYVIGLFMKGIPKFPDWAIPLTLLAFAICMTIVYSAISLEQGFGAKTVVDGIVQGIIIASIAVYCNQMLKQIVTQRKLD